MSPGNLHRQVEAHTRKIIEHDCSNGDFYRRLDHLVLGQREAWRATAGNGGQRRATAGNGGREAACRDPLLDHNDN
ncbi:hypothetical protein PG991_012113 [Apiospora marii]|uniref:Uncharacterized protein n=1 Tax=Apiospora marii TaxID=335849 RepID=A0ABR1R9P0_9PEZI